MKKKDKKGAFSVVVSLLDSSEEMNEEGMKEVTDWTLLKSKELKKTKRKERKSGR